MNSTTSDLDKGLRKELLALLRGGNAHMSFDDAVSGFPMEQINRKVPNATYTPWHVIEHMRIAQWDILRFVIDPGHVSPEWPAGYWPQPDAIATPAQWKKSIKQFHEDLARVEEIVKNPRTDFCSPIPHAKDYTVLREVLLVADHNAYHLGGLVTLMRVLDLKPL